MSEIQVGSVVKLKSGGLLMTVDKIFKDTAGIDSATCVWFDSSESLKNGVFKFHVLKIVKES